MNNSSKYDKVIYEFHVAKSLREKYELDEIFFSITGNVIFANFYQVRVFTQKLNNKRSVENHLSPGEVNAVGLLDEIYHIAIRNYFKKNFPNAFQDAITNVKEILSEEKFDSLLLDFIKVFPPHKVFKNELKPEEYLNQYSNNISNREILIEELLLLHLANLNPAFQKLKELFDDNYISEKEVYKSTLINLEQFFKKEEFRIGINNIDLFSFLKMPFQKYSTSLWDQLVFIKNEWGIFIDPDLINKIFSSQDLFIESIKFDQHFGGGGGAPTIVPQYKGKAIDASSLVIGKSKFKYAEDSTKDYDEPEQFTPDTNWMPKLVLIAKNIYVWMDQLSKKYQREIKTLDQIPIEELAQLKKWNINSLWLIGVWERSNASKKIKHMMGNVDAVASAYSLYDYQIANDLGGEAAYNIFNERAKSQGIRLASDMVPNHTGIYSKWIVEHPEYFIQLDYSPFPNYKFTGENLSEHHDVEIRIEDQYWAKTDAAVVFQRRNSKTGEVKYIYHGNDGTNMPWNDTAQLNLLKAEVREAVIQKIFEVARKFSVIRFDAAMTLAKKHFSRLWYPEPGKGGDIPSRADFALSRARFDELFPKEFWREVVDRINTEMPETLLLAEAFWLMEGYFVRTLGMHRVYNSAFMNMLMKENNAEYRELITNTLEFEPEILKRYVNFMSNPDEETAIDQFGTDDKYFGVLILMCTLPGLPMLAHGQIEGFKEKYGMEYQRAYYNEIPNHWLVEKHEKEVFPILGKRYLFADVDNFWLYDFVNKNKKLNENVFAYTNSARGETALVIYNNKFEAANGFINFSRQKLSGSGDNKYLSNIKISDNLRIQNSDFHFYIFKNTTNNLEYLFNGSDINKKGLQLNLNGFEYRVFISIEELFDTTGKLFKFYKENFGIGIWDIKDKLNDIDLQPVQHEFKKIFADENIPHLLDLTFAKTFKVRESKALLKEIENKYTHFSKKMLKYFNIDYSLDSIDINFGNKLNTVVNLIKIGKIKKVKKSKTDLQIIEMFSDKHKLNWILILIYETILSSRETFGENEIAESFPENIKIKNPVQQILKRFNNSNDEVTRKIILLNLLITFEKDFVNLNGNLDDVLKIRTQKELFGFLTKTNNEFLNNLFNNELTQTLIDVNEYEGKQYFNKERFADFVSFLLQFVVHQIFLSIISKGKGEVIKEKKVLSLARKSLMLETYLNNLASDSKYVFTDFMKNFQEEKKQQKKVVSKKSKIKK